MWTITLSGEREKQPILMMASHIDGEGRSSRRTFKSFHLIRNWIRNWSHWNLTRNLSFKYGWEVSVLNSNILAVWEKPKFLYKPNFFNAAQKVLAFFLHWGTLWGYIIRSNMCPLCSSQVISDLFRITAGRAYCIVSQYAYIQNAKMLQ